MVKGKKKIAAAALKQKRKERQKAEKAEASAVSDKEVAAAMADAAAGGVVPLPADDGAPPAQPAAAAGAKGKKKRKGKGGMRKPDKTRGVVYIGHVPHGFYEDQMRKFLGQYGAVSRLRISRSKKSGKSHGYAFAQYVDPDVAEDVAQELHGTYLTGRVLQVKVVPPAKVHPNLWKGMKLSILQRKDEDRRVNGKMVHYQPPSQKTVEQRLLAYVDRERAMNAKLKAAGFEYEFHGFEDQLKPLGVTYVPKKKSAQPAAGGKGVLDKPPREKKVLLKKKRVAGGGAAVKRKRAG